MQIAESRPYSYYLIDFIGIAAVLYCLYANFWILLAALIAYAAIKRGAHIGAGIAVCAALIYDPLLFLVTLIAVCIWMFYGPEYRRQFDKIDF